MQSFDTQFPPSTPLGTILDDMPVKFADHCSCREDWERFERLVGAINLLRTQLDRGYLSVVHARECLKDLWGSDDGDESSEG